jgi:hypothetical protein
MELFSYFLDVQTSSHSPKAGNNHPADSYTILIYSGYGNL